MKEREVREHLEDLLNREQILWAQKAKINWDLNGDRNTRYFQAMVKTRRRRNSIVQLKNDQDQW
ncbi:reverse transcriptase, partial [Fagus crenata]